MNARCPQCGQPISDDFGVIVCPHCQAVLFVDLNGNIQLSDSTSAAAMAEGNNEILSEAAEQEEAVYATGIQPPEGLDVSHLPSAEPQATTQETQFGTLARFHSPDEPPAPDSSMLESIHSEFQKPPMGSEEIFAEENPEISEEEIRSESVTFPRVAIEPDEPLMEDTSPIDDFVDHEAISGPMTYTVTIERIDTKNLRAQLQDVFDDPKFQWSSTDLIRRIRQGRLTLKNLSPVKASVLISKIKELPLKISWTQQVFK